MKLCWTVLVSLLFIQMVHASMLHSSVPISPHQLHFPEPSMLRSPAVVYQSRRSAAYQSVRIPKAPLQKKLTSLPQPDILTPAAVVYQPRRLAPYQVMRITKKPIILTPTAVVYQPRRSASYRIVQTARVPIQKRTQLKRVVRPRANLHRSLPAVDAVYVQGNLDLKMDNQKASSINYQREYPQLKVTVMDRGVYIVNPPLADNKIRPVMTLHLKQQLRRLTVSGNSRINGHFNSSCGLSIVHCGSGSLCLTGPINVTAIENTGCASISISNVNSCELHILATRRAKVSVTGCVGLLLIRAFNCASVDTRCLRSTNAMVQAGDESLVTVSTCGDLQAFASGISNIYYYITPRNLSDHTMFSGNVLPMGCCCY